jgi:hypothetical protein
MKSEISQTDYHKALTDLPDINSEIKTHLNIDHMGKSVGIPLATYHRCGNLAQLRITTIRIINRFESPQDDVPD